MLHVNAITYSSTVACVFLLQFLSCVFSLTQELGRNNIREPVVSISVERLQTRKYSL